MDGSKHPNKRKRYQFIFNEYQVVKFVNFCKNYACFDCVVINHQKGGDCNKHGTFYAVLSDFGDQVTTNAFVK